MQIELEALSEIKEGETTEYQICIKNKDELVKIDLQVGFWKRGIDYSGVDHDADYVELFAAKNDRTKLFIAITSYEWGYGFTKLLETKWYLLNGTISTKIKAEEVPSVKRLDNIHSSNSNRKDIPEGREFEILRNSIDAIS